MHHSFNTHGCFDICHHGSAAALLKRISSVCSQRTVEIDENALLINESRSVAVTVKSNTCLSIKSFNDAC